VLAYDRLVFFFVEMDRADDTSLFTLPAAYAAFGLQYNAAALPFFQSSGRTCLRTGSLIPASQAYYADKFTLETSTGSDTDCTFAKRMILAVDA
jgi:hypothetical protein